MAVFQARSEITVGTEQADSIFFEGDDWYVDEIHGLGGNDTYYIDAEAYDEFGTPDIREAADGGIDTVNLEIDGDSGINSGYLDLYENVENLNLELQDYEGSFDVYANDSANNIVVDVDAETPFPGKYSYVNVEVFGGDGNDSITINGYSHDYIRGGDGADTMAGGFGEDIYYVDNVGDKVIEGVDAGYDTVYSSVSHTLSANVEGLLLQYGDGEDPANINGTGNAHDNYIVGNDGNNILLGLAGDDEIYGEDGNDTIDGGDGGDYLEGGYGKDTIKGGNGDDELIGDDSGYYADTLIGGAGNDFYVVDDLDVVTEAAGGGDDTIETYYQLSGDLAANVENLILGGNYGEDEDLNGRGNVLNNIIQGNGGRNTLEGLAGNDTLDGGEDSDTLIGGTGNDIYVVDNSGDKVVELANEGTDTVYSSANAFTLSANVENLVLVGNNSYVGSGNALDNKITGNDNSNYLSGGAGNDILDGGEDADIMNGGAGNDIYVVDNSQDIVIGELAGGGNDTVRSSVTFTLGANLENLELLQGYYDIDAYGNALNNKITGNDGDNIIYGGKGADTMIGGKGDDFYYVDKVGTGLGFDVITEKANEGDDTVFVSGNASFDLSLAANANIENLIFDQVINVTVTGKGNALDNFISGSRQDDFLSGGAGKDVLNGGAGNDEMTGGDGNDTYIVGSAGDKVIETNADQAVGGIDHVKASVSYSLLNSNNVENLTLVGNQDLNGTGNGLNNKLIGNDGENHLMGLGGNDILDGGDGQDVLEGGTGNDTYYVDNYYDNVTEAANAGTDTVISTAFSFGLSNDVENLTLLEEGNGYYGYGNNQANVITGNSNDNVLVGYDGNDNLIGGAGDDFMDGGAGKDTLKGGAGDDYYHVDFDVNTGLLNDVVAENGNEGNDTVILGFADAEFTLSAPKVIAYTLGANIENAEVFGISEYDFVSGQVVESGAYFDTNAKFNITGNTLNNGIEGNDANNVLLGLAGNDILDGNAGADTLNGGDGNDDLDGGGNDGDADMLIGGNGNDTYWMEDVDKISGETSGIDSIYFEGVEGGLSLKDTARIGGTVENLYVVESVNGVEFIGSDIANILGVGASDMENEDLPSFDVTLDGGAGNDTLTDHFTFQYSDSDGELITENFDGIGNNTFIGGAGDDVFDIHHLSNGDTFFGGTEEADAGNDTLNLHLGQPEAPASFEVNSAGIETVNVDVVESGFESGGYYAPYVSSDPVNVTLDFAGSSGVNQINLKFVEAEDDPMDHYYDEFTTYFGADISLLGLSNGINVDATGFEGLLELEAKDEGETTVNLAISNSYIELNSNNLDNAVDHFNINISGENELDVEDITGDITLTGDGVIDLNDFGDSGSTTLSLESLSGSVYAYAGYNVETIQVDVDNASVTFDVYGYNLETVTINSIGDGGELVLDTEGADINVTGDADLVLSGLDEAYVNASAFTGENFTAIVSGYGSTIIGSNNVADGELNPGTVDTIIGGDGNDTIETQSGDDLVYGGGGADTFVFNFSDTGVDHILDFQDGYDVISLEGFVALTDDGFGGLAESEFFSGTFAQLAELGTESAHNLIYIENTGNLYYDADGGGEGEMVLIANFGNADLSYSDFQIPAPPP